MSKSERLERRKVLSALLSANVGRTVCDAVLAEKFDMTKPAVGKLCNLILESWTEEEADMRPHYKRIQVRRLTSYIAAAKSQRNWGAVASFERLLAQITGTLEPIEVRVSGDIQVRENLLLMVEQMTPARLLALADRARRLHALPAADTAQPPGEAVPIDATG